VHQRLIVRVIISPTVDAASAIVKFHQDRGFIFMNSQMFVARRPSRASNASAILGPHAGGSSPVLNGNLLPIGVPVED